MRVTRPPALWLNDPNIRTLQEACKRYRREAHTPPHSEAAWDIFKDARNSLKKLIGKAKRGFMTNALSSKRPKEVWKTIHRILHPSQQPITVYPDNKHFTSAAERVDASVAVDKEELHRRINALAQDTDTSFRLKSVTYHEVIRESKALRSDCSTGPDNIPTKFIKLVPDHLASPLTHILNTCISKLDFPTLWKVARISPIPKVGEPQANDDFRPVFILPVLSKVYERLS